MRTAMRQSEHDRPACGKIWSGIWGALGQIYHSKNTYLKHRIKVFTRLIYTRN